MLLDKNGKLLGKISLIDIAIVLFLVFAIGAGAIHLQKNQEPEVLLSVTVTATDVTNEIAALLRSYTGEYTDAQGAIIGKAEYAYAEQEVPTEIPVTDHLPEDGAEPAMVPAPDSYLLTITLSCPGSEDDAFFRLRSGNPVAVGDRLILTGGGTRIQVTVSDITVKSTATN